MKIIIFGGSGYLGRMLHHHFDQQGHEVLIIGRKPAKPGGKTWDGKNLGRWIHDLEGADVVVNLAGRNVNCRYHGKNKREIFESRINATRTLGQAIHCATRPPKVWLQMSTATIYAHTFNRSNDEARGTIGGNEFGAPKAWRFSTDVAKAWEEEADHWSRPGTRLVKLRTAMILSPHAGGVLHMLARLAKLGFGGHSGDGSQYVSWMHYKDFLASIDWVLSQNDLFGPVNLAAPQPLPNKSFMGFLRRALGMKWGVSSPHWMLAIGAFFLRTETELLLKSRRVVPGRLLNSGFNFAFPAWESAAADLCRDL